MCGASGVSEDTHEEQLGRCSLVSEIEITFGSDFLRIHQIGQAPRVSFHLSPNAIFSEEIRWDIEHVV